MRNAFQTIWRGLKELVRSSFSRRLLDYDIHSGPLRGCKIHTSLHDYPGAILGTTERSLLDWFAQNVERGETWLDIGGNYGYTAIALSRLVGAEGRVFAFEPVIGTAGCLARTRELNRLDQLTVVPLALIADPELQSMEIPVTRGMADSTLIDTTSCETSACERIFGIALDSIWASIAHLDTSVHGVKIDVQGMEFQVLRGMREQLTHWNPKLVIEFHRGVDRLEILDLLVSCGYSPNFERVGDAPANILADDVSYAFVPEAQSCVYSSTRSTTARS